MSDKETAVRHNVETFLKILSRVRPKPSVTSLVVQAWVNRQTGELQEAPPLDLSRWKCITIQCVYDGEAVHFEQESAPSLDPVAARVFESSLKRFQKVGDAFKGQGNLKAQIQHLSSLNEPVSITDQRLMQAAWYDVDRSGAEELLGIGGISPPQGTYLFRKDLFAALLESQCPYAIECVTLTLLASDQKVSDYTLVRLAGQWQVYNDDPQLEQPSFPTLEALLKAKKALFIHPLYKQ